MCFSNSFAGLCREFLMLRKVPDVHVVACSPCEPIFLVTLEENEMVFIHPPFIYEMLMRIYQTSFGKIVSKVKIYLVFHILKDQIHLFNNKF